MCHQTSCEHFSSSLKCIYLLFVCCINLCISVHVYIFFAYVCRDQGGYWLPFLYHFILFPPDQVSVEPGEPCFLVRLEVTKCQGMSCLCILSTGIIGVHHYAWLLHRCWGSNSGPYACIANTCRPSLEKSSPNRQKPLLCRYISHGDQPGLCQNFRYLLDRHGPCLWNAYMETANKECA